MTYYYFARIGTVILKNFQVHLEGVVVTIGVFDKNDSVFQKISPMTR